MAPNFENKVIAITGGASGMGLATAKFLAQQGASVSLADVQESALTSAAEAIQSIAPDAKVVTHVTDVRDRAQLEAWMKKTVSELGKLDGAANLAGVIGKRLGKMPVDDIDDDEWDFVLGVNLTGIMKTMRAEVSCFKESGGSIVNAASVAGQVGRKGGGAYAASKHGVIGLSRTAAKDLGSKGIRVNCIAPGYILTPMVATAAQISETKPEKNPEVLGTALGRPGQPEEVSNLIAFLLSDDSSFITGSVNNIDGGWIC